MNRVFYGKAFLPRRQRPLLLVLALVANIIIFVVLVKKDVFRGLESHVIVGSNGSMLSLSSDTNGQPGHVRDILRVLFQWR